MRSSATDVHQGGHHEFYHADCQVDPADACVARCALFTLTLAIGGLAGCRPVDRTDPTEDHAQAVTVQREFRLALPKGAKLHELAVVASSSLRLGAGAFRRGDARFFGPRGELRYRRDPSRYRRDSWRFVESG